MPPEPLPWDRKDVFKERKHERSDSLGSTPRWRDSSSSHYGSNRDLSRWGASNEFRRTPGHGKQGGWHLFTEESGNAYMPARSSEKTLEDENFRASLSRGDGKYSRNGRENRGSFSQRDWKGQSWEMNNGSPNMHGRLHDASNDQRLVDGTLTYAATHPPSDFVNTWEQLQLKGRHDSNKIDGVNGLGPGQKVERENSLDWKPLKWTRSGSLSSRGSGFSHSSSSKSLGGVDSNDAKLQPKNVTPVQSPSGDAAACVTSAAPSDEMISRKKPRLGWGEGLAKYEKKKVEVPDVGVNKEGAVISAAEPIHSQSLNLAEKSPRIMGFSDCASPATPSSVACSSSPGIEEKTFGKAVNVDNDVGNLCGSPGVGSQSYLEGLPFNLEKLDLSSIASLGTSLNELLQFDDTSSVDSSFVRSTAMNKLLVWKSDVSKALEVTESEIDLLENELKSLKSGTGCPCPVLSCLLQEDGNVKLSNKPGTVLNNISQQQADSCEGEISQNIGLCNGTSEVRAGSKDDDIDSSETVPRVIEPLLSLVNAVSSSDMKHDECTTDLGAVQYTSMELRNPGHCGDEEVTTALTCEDANALVNSEDDPVFLGDMRLSANGEDNLYNLILASNKESSSRASEVFNKLLPRDPCKIDFMEATSVLPRQNDALVKEKFAMRQRYLRFKERVVTHKFKAFRHLWKEDMRLLSVRKYRAKSQKNCELSLRTASGGYQRHRSSIRSRFSSPAGSLSLVPTTEILNFTSKLLSDSQVKLQRNVLRMPALILDEKERTASRFISSNGLVEDPCAAEKERVMINPWTLEEREIFREKLATFGKDFKKIASFLDHKTTADCVEFYYKNHKSDCFQKTKKHKQSKSSTNYFMSSSSGKKWNREINAASLDILGAASVMAADADNVMRKRQMYSGRIILGGYGDSKTSQSVDGFIQRSGNFDILGSERETVAADVLAGICGSVSSEAMSSCITTSADPGEGYQERKYQKTDSAAKRNSTSDVTQNVDEETCSDESCGEMDPEDWTDEEKVIFVQAVSLYGKDFVRISQYVRTRSSDQCRVFFSKARKCLGLDLLRNGAGNLGTSGTDDVNGGGSDTEDACVLQTAPVICGDKLSSKRSEDLLRSVMDAKPDEFDAVNRVNLHSDLSRSEDNNATRLLDQKDSKGVEALVSGPCQMENGHEQSTDVESKSINGYIHESEAAQAQTISTESINTEVEKAAAEGGIAVAESVSGEGAVECPRSTNGGVVEFSGNENSNDMEGYESLQPENCSTGPSDLLQDANVIKDSSDHPKDKASCYAKSMNQGSVELNSVEKPPVVSLALVSNLPASNFTLEDSSAVRRDKICNQESLSSMVTTQGSSNEQGQKSHGKDINLHFSGQPLVSNNESSKILRGCPLQIPTKRETNSDISCKPLPEVQIFSNSERNADSQFVVKDCYLQKFSSSKTQSPMHQLSLLSQPIEQPSDHLRDHVPSLSDAEKPCRNGDVKLFGKILTNPSPLQSSNVGTPENEENGTTHPKSSSKSSTLKFAPQTTDGNAGILKFDCNNYLSPENTVPMRSYGFWDGNRIQTGFSSLPDSAVLLAKYPAAFSNYHASSSKMDQQALQSVVKSSDRNLNGVSVFPPRELSGSNGSVDYQTYRSHDGAKMQPFAVDIKQRQELFSEMQRHSGFEVMPGLQQQGGAMVGVNVVGRGGVIVGGQCAGVSDPVAALKMHYARTDQYGGQNGVIFREEESWRGKDIGR